ncbi:MAG: NAD-dependent succinate-semialdehyde dehydrogenase [Deltaproteobacteria bacterium]|nr:NAD-dependent succinate-semialdehyde dehydrogenase [Deltaproteobacteria bacterium]
MISMNPATEELIKDYPEHEPQEVDAALDQAARAFAGWRETPFTTRAGLMHEAARVLRDGAERYARLMTREMGKTIVSAQAEVEKCAWVCDYYADTAEEHLAPERIATDASDSFVRFDPLGPVLAVMPWNFPFWQVFRFAAPALMAGNTALLKHASNVPGCALAIEEIFHAAGFPEGTFRTLLVGSRAVESMIRHPVVQAVTLTGSEPAGIAVASQAGSVLKKTVLELGGADPFIVLADADIVDAAANATLGRCINTGQSCIAAKRFIVEDRVADQFEEVFTARMKDLKVGDPMDRGTDIGPMAREDLLDELQDQVDRSLKEGARLVTGGQRLDRRGYYYPPTVIADVKPGMAVFDEETFGPVAPVIRARDADHAVELANSSALGLGGSVWTSDTEKGRALAARIESGSVFVNGIVKSDPRLPFGGVKRSGYGRELSRWGIREFVNIKTVWIR